MLWEMAKVAKLSQSHKIGSHTQIRGNCSCVTYETGQTAGLDTNNLNQQMMLTQVQIGIN